jgi:uncharacterized protein YkvS
MFLDNWIDYLDDYTGLGTELNENEHIVGCKCVDCFGDFSGASEDEEFGGR